MRTALLSIAALGLLAIQCVPAAEEPSGSGAAQHTASDPTYENSPYFWAETDYATFRSVAQAAPFAVGQPLDATSVVAKRLQAWADRIHDEVKRDVRQKTGKELVAARPVIVVVPAKEPNAWVSGVPACITGQADLSALSKPGRPDKSVPLAFIENARIKEAFPRFGAPPPRCLRPKSWPNRPDELLAFVNASGSKCKLHPAGDTVKVTGEGCALDANDAATTASQLTYYATSPYVHFTTAIIAMANDERSIAGIVAHELGHYYRAHAVSQLLMGKYDYWYERKDPPDTKVPAPARDSAELETTFRRVAPYPMPVVAGQKLSYRLSNLLTDALGSLLESASLCPEATAALGSDWRYSFAGFSGGYVDAATRDKYLAYEAKLLACAPTVRVTASGDALKLGDLRDAIATGAREFAAPAVAEGTLAEVLDTLHQRASMVDRDATAFHESLRTRRIGRWTAEQEADDFSLEYYARAAMDPGTRIESNFAIIKERTKDDRFAWRNGGLTFAACEALYRSGWMKDGERAFVPLGDLHDPHHGDCYRLFNLSEEQRAHGYRASGTAPSLEGTWEQVQAEARRATDGFTPGGGGHGGGPFGMPQPASGGPLGGMIIDAL